MKDSFTSDALDARTSLRGNPRVLQEGVASTAALEKLDRAWLRAVDRLRATATGGPNFAYELCLRRADPEQVARLDLSCWQVAFNGAEPIRPQTLERFARMPSMIELKIWFTTLASTSPGDIASHM